MKKPLTITYGVDERPPLEVTFLSGLQHVGVISIILVYPLLLARAAGLPQDATLDILGVSMLVMGIGAVVQALPRGPVGAHFLCPVSFTAAYLTPSLVAVKTGGLSVVLGMTTFGGFVEAVLSRTLRPLRPYFPPEISGFVVVMIGVAVGSLAVRNVLGIGAAGSIDGRHLAVVAISLTAMIGLNVWTDGAPRFFCVLVGMLIGTGVATVVGLISAADFAVVRTAPLVRVPSHAYLGWSLDGGMAIPFAVAAVATVIRTMGDVTLCQRMNNTDWVRPDAQSLAGGVLANGLVNIAAGFLGTMGVSTSTASVGLAGATGVTSRRVAYAIGATFVLLAFLPKLNAVLIIMPAPVVGAALLFTATFIFVNGLQIVTSRILDARRTLVIGLSFMLGVSVDLYPAVFAGAPAFLRPLVGSSLVLGTVTALLLNLIFRVGVRRTQVLRVELDGFDPRAVEDFIDAQGATWGARRDVIDRAKFTLTQSIEAIAERGDARGPLEIEASFDEFNLDVRVSYAGPTLELPEKRPTNEEIMASEEGQRRLAGFVLRRYADRVQTTHRAGRSTILFHFDH